MAAKISDENAVEDLPLGVLAIREDVGVDTGGRADARMAEPLGDEFEVFPCFEEQGRVRVTEAVETEPRRKIFMAIIADRGHMLLENRRAVFPAADTSTTILVVFAIAQLVLRLPCVRGFQDADELRSDSYGARA